MKAAEFRQGYLDKQIDIARKADDDPRISAFLGGTWYRKVQTIYVKNGKVSHDEVLTEINRRERSFERYRKAFLRKAENQNVVMWKDKSWCVLCRREIAAGEPREVHRSYHGEHCGFCLTAFLDEEELEIHQAKNSCLTEKNPIMGMIVDCDLWWNQIRHVHAKVVWMHKQLKILICNLWKGENKTIRSYNWKLSEDDNIRLRKLVYHYLKLDRRFIDTAWECQVCQQTLDDSLTHFCTYETRRQQIYALWRYHVQGALRKREPMAVINAIVNEFPQECLPSLADYLWQIFWPVISANVIRHADEEGLNLLLSQLNNLFKLLPSHFASAPIPDGHRSIVYFQSDEPSDFGTLLPLSQRSTSQRRRLATQATGAAEATEAIDATARSFLYNLISTIFSRNDIKNRPSIAPYNASL